MITVYFFSQTKHLEISFLPCLQIISGPWKVMSGFSVVENELGKVYGQFLRLISHNRATVSSYYTDITKEKFIDSFWGWYHTTFSSYYTDITNDILLLQMNMEDLSPREWIIASTVESRYVKLGLLEISIKSKYFWSPLWNLVLFNLIYSSYLKFRCVEISGFSK
jgi:hypothetical protein